MTTVVNVKTDLYDVWIARGGQWGNPYHIGQHGIRDEVIEQYREFLLHTPELLLQLPMLRGKILGCFCKPQRCHGDILAEYADMTQGTWWFSNDRMTFGVTTNGEHIIIDAAPIARKFIGQPLTNLAKWMKRMGPTDIMLVRKENANNNSR